MGAMHNENNPQVSEIALGSISASGDVYGFLLPKKSRIKSAYVVNSATIAASDTDYFQLELKLGSTQIAEMDSRAAHENGVVANVPKAMNVVSANSLVAGGSYLKATYTEAGTMALTTAKLIIEWYPL